MSLLTTLASRRDLAPGLRYGATSGMLRRIAIEFGFLLGTASMADAMTFTWRDPLTIHASGPIEAGDAAQFAGLPKFDTLELDSPGGLVAEALRIAANMDARGGIRTVVKPGSSCASACAMALFVSGETRIVYMGGRLGIHSCAMPDGTPAPECNATMAANATGHGVPWAVIESVRKLHAGLHSFRSMRRMEARRKKASALRLRHSQSLASLRQRPSQARVRSTIQRLGRTTKPLA